MKAIINGKRYDTEKAILIGEADNLGYGCDSVTDFSFWEASLYKSPRAGRYFLSGRGGPMTRWSRKIAQNGWSGGSGIIPLDDAEAFEWAQAHLDTNLVEKFFGDQVHDA